MPCTISMKRAEPLFEHYLNISKYDFPARMLFELLKNLAADATVILDAIEVGCH